jgi:hypothetical protein
MTWPAPTHPCPACGRLARLLGGIWHAECTHRFPIEAS